MRSTNKRSRSKPNRPKSLGNIINRVFDSSGPEGKVRGTPQQIIEKYQVLARDAQLSNDRVAAENFQQHAEHYTRLLAQAQREMQAEQEARRQSQEDRNRQQQQQDERAQQNGRRNEQRRGGDDAAQHGGSYANGGPRDTAVRDAFSVEDSEQGAEEATLVETPESKLAQEAAAPQEVMPEPSAAEPKPANRRKPRAPKADNTVEAAAEDKPKPKPRRAPRKPRKAEGEGETSAAGSNSTVGE